MLFSNFAGAQYSGKELDSLMTKEYYRLRKERKFEEIIALSRKVIAQSKKIKYLKGEIYGYTRMGNMQYNLRNYKEAITSLNRANQLVEDHSFEDNTIKASINMGIGLCYYTTESSYQNAVKQYDKALIFANKIEDETDRKFYLYLIYSNFYGLYSDIKNRQKEVYYLRKALSVNETSYMLTELARYHNLYSKRPDSAKYYLGKSQRIAKTDFEKAALYNQWGKYYENLEDYASAIRLYVINEKLARKTEEAPLQEDALIGLSYSHKKMGNLQKAYLYSEKLNAFKDSMKMLQIQNSNIAVSDIITKNGKEIHQKFSNIWKIYVGLAVLLLIILFIFGAKIYKNEKKKDLAIIHKKNEQNLKLKQKVNESFEEVVLLAKDNHPEFLTRFLEVYPDFRKNLFDINPGLVMSEIRFCALIFLNFSTKEIANYTFTSTKTVQNRKNSIRKRLNISSDTDLYVWFSMLDAK